MQQYSANNQEFIKQQMPTATECRSMKQWNAMGMQVVKGSKAIRIFTPSGIGRVFDISQVQPRKANTANQVRRIELDRKAAAFESEYDEYANDTANMDDPPSFAEWHESKQAQALALIESGQDPWSGFTFTHATTGVRV